jgi:hypothetical protein
MEVCLNFAFVLTIINCVGKAKLALPLKHHTIQAYGEVEVKFHSFLTLPLNVSGQLHTPDASSPLPQVKLSSILCLNRMGGSQSRSGRGGEETHPCPDTVPKIRSVESGMRYVGRRFRRSYIDLSR